MPVKSSLPFGVFPCTKEIRRHTHLVVVLLFSFLGGPPQTLLVGAAFPVSLST